MPLCLLCVRRISSHQKPLPLKVTSDTRSLPDARVADEGSAQTDPGPLFRCSHSSHPSSVSTSKPEFPN